MKTIAGNGWSLKATDIPLKRLGGAGPAGLWITSLPWPRQVPHELTLNGNPTYCQPLGCWPESHECAPRRLLLVADGGDEAPETVALCGSTATSCKAAPPQATTVCFEKSPDKHFGWERHYLKLEYGERTIGIAMGLRTGTEWHWWEACRLVIREETPTCRVIEMGGAIPLVHSNNYSKEPGYQNNWLHKHHWLYGQIEARLHANGVCEVVARHVNSKFFDDGGDLQPAVPVVGFWCQGTDAIPDDLPGAWDGSRDSFTLGGVKFDVTEVARLATPEQPGRIARNGDLMIWQPYRGCELYGGVCATQRRGDGYVLHAEDETILRGMARTLRFSLSLSERSPRVVRYLAPDWWYGLCEEFTPAPLLPAYGVGETHLTAARHWVHEANVVRGFEDGAVARSISPEKERREYEPGWEGEVPYSMFLSAWRYGNAADYDAALRSACHFSDLAVDHAANLVRMHGFPPVAFSVPMNRVQGSFAAYLETGDSFLRNTAEKVVEAAHRTNLNAWPRMAVGRDVCYVRSAVLLYRYTGNPHFKQIAYEGALTAVESQRPNGSFGDQGGGTGIHQWGGYISKPWMGLMATNGMLDYLEVVGDEPRLAAAVQKFADWLMAERSDRNGVLSWGYQHDYWGGRTHKQNATSKVINLPGPNRWHQENIGRLMCYCASRCGRADYLDAWAESHAGSPAPIGDHNVTAALQFLPWLAAHLWQSRLDGNGNLTVEALHYGPRTFPTATISTPAGQLQLKWQSDGTICYNQSIPAKITTKLLNRG